MSHLCCHGARKSRRMCEPLRHFVMILGRREMIGGVVRMMFSRAARRAQVHLDTAKPRRQPHGYTT